MQIKRLVILTVFFILFSGSSLADMTTEVFNSDGTFNVPDHVDQVNVVVVGGGGADQGGGGAGGVIAKSDYSVTPGSNINVVVGLGGRGSGGRYGGDAFPENGEDSEFGSLTALGGGWGGTHDDSEGPPPRGNDGGSGGEEQREDRVLEKQIMD